MSLCSSCKVAVPGLLGPWWHCRQDQPSLKLKLQIIISIVFFKKRINLHFSMAAQLLQLIKTPPVTLELQMSQQHPFLIVQGHAPLWSSGKSGSSCWCFLGTCFLDTAGEFEFELCSCYLLPNSAVHPTTDPSAPSFLSFVLVLKVPCLPMSVKIVKKAQTTKAAHLTDKTGRCF